MAFASGGSALVGYLMKPLAQTLRLCGELVASKAKLASLIVNYPVCCATMQWCGFFEILSHGGI